MQHLLIANVTNTLQPQTIVFIAHSLLFWKYRRAAFKTIDVGLTYCSLDLQKKIFSQGLCTCVCGTFTLRIVLRKSNCAKVKSYHFTICSKMKVGMIVSVIVWPAFSRIALMSLSCKIKKRE